MLRAAASALRAACGCRPSSVSIEDDGVAAAGGQAPGLVDGAARPPAPAASRGRGEADRSGRARRGPSFHSEISSGRTPARTTRAPRGPRWPASAAPAGAAPRSCPRARAPTIVTREPLPNGVSHSIAFSVGSSEPSARRSVGNAAGRSSKRVPSATSSAGRPLIVSMRTSDGEALGAARRAHGAGDPVAGDELAALDLRRGDVDVVVGGLRAGRRARSPSRWRSSSTTPSTARRSASSAVRRRARSRLAAASASRGRASRSSRRRRPRVARRGERPRPPRRAARRRRRPRCAPLGSPRRPAVGRGLVGRVLLAAPSSASAASAVGCGRLAASAASIARRSARRPRTGAVAALLAEDRVDQVGLAQRR